MNIITNAWNNILNGVDKKIIKFILPLKKCIFCLNYNSTWKNRVSGVYACDKCVPRDCFCRAPLKVKRAVFLIQNYEYRKGNKIRDLPCEDWNKI